VRTAALSDPEVLSLRSNLAIGAIGAVMLSVVGFLFHFMLIRQGRVAEYAILEANGMKGSLIRRSLRIEQLLVLLCGVLAGVAVGMALSFSLVGALDLGTDVQQRIPPAVFAIDTEWMVGLLTGVLAAVFLAVVVLSRIGARGRLADMLRYM
jgi:ABC-type antimicrobial peptide transport system permease subunit